MEPSHAPGLRPGDETLLLVAVVVWSLLWLLHSEDPKVSLMREALDCERDDSPFVPDPPGALDALIAEYESA